MAVAAAALLGLLAIAGLAFFLAQPAPALAQSPPDAVGSITLTRSGSTLTVSWNAVDGAAKYHALYQADSAGDWLPPIPDYQNITATSFSFDIDSSKSYVVGVRAGNANGWGAWTDSPASNPPLPDAVGSITLTRSGSTLTVSWNAVDGAAKYHALYQADGAGDWLPPIPDYQNITATSFTFNIDSSKSYIVGVRAGNSAGWGPWTDSPASNPPLPAAVGSITLTRSDTTLTVSWNAVDGAAKYHALYQADGAGDWLPPITDYKNITDTGFTFDVDNGKSYVVGVRAGNSAGWGPWTDSPTSGPYTPMTVTATRGSDGDTASVSWTAYEGENFEYYRVIVCDDTQYNGASCAGTVWTGAPVWDANSTGPVSVTGLDAGTGYGVILQTWRNGSALKSHATLPAGPAAPDNLAVNPGNGYLDLSWNAVTGATAYDIRARAAGVNDWHSVANKVTATTYRYTTDQTIDQVAVRAANAHSVGNWTELSRLPDHGWLNTVQSSNTGGASAASGGGSIASQLSAPAWGTITRYDDTKRRSGRIDVNWTGDSNATGYNLVCAVAGSTPASTGWNWHPCGWIDSTTDTVKFTTVPANASQPVGIVSYQRGDESQLPPGIIPLEGSQAALTIPRMYAVAIRAVSATDNASAWVPSASIKPLNPQLSNLAHTRTDGQIALSWTPNPYTTGYKIDCAVQGSSYTRCATLTNQDHSATQHSVTISTWTAGGTNYAIDNSSIYDIRICSANTWGSGCHLAPLINPNTTLTPSGVSKTTATLTIAQHTGNWYYRHTGAGATCDGPVSGTSKALTDLTAGTTYTFSAYSNSTCSTLLATATPFTTGSSISNLNSDKGSILSSIESTRTGAQAFSTGSNASGYILKKVTLPLKNVTATSSNLVVTLHAMKGEGSYTKNSEPASNPLSTLSGTAPTGNTWTDTPYTCSGSGCKLSPNTTYFVKAVYAQTGYYEWAYTDDKDSREVNVPSDNGWDLLYDHYGEGGVWRSYEDQYLAEILFENVPNPELTASNIGATTATLTIAHHAGNWYYKHTGAGATCDGPVSGTSKNLTGLTAGATYSYSAYSDSSCTTGNLLAAATGFTTHYSVSNLTSTKHTTFESQVHSNLSAAVAFTTGSNVGGYILKSVTAPLKHTGGINGVIFQLNAMEGTGQYSSTSQATSVPLATLSTATPTASTYTDTTVTCSGSGCRLSANTTYFIVASNVDIPPSYSWAVSKSETETAQPSDNGWSIGFGHSKQGARESIWSSYSDWNPVEIVFVNAPSLTASNVAATTATLTITDHRGGWYYKHTNTGATCDGPVSGTSKDLTGLTANTSYTYSAYSDSGCTSGNLLATAAQFTTLVGDKASVSNLSETVVGLFTVQTGASHAQEFTTGNTTGAYNLTSVTVDFTLVTDASVVTVAIHDKQSNGQPAASARTTLTGTAANGQSEFTCTGSGCTLDANTSYFVHVSVNAAIASYPSSTASDDQTLTPTGTGWSIANAARSQSGNWAELGNGQSMRIKVAANVAAKLTASSVTSTTATLTIARHTGAWWYERTAPTGDTTCHSVAAGTTTANLSSLTASTSYTYKAYDQSGCNSADEIATATFTTPSS